MYLVKLEHPTEDRIEFGLVQISRLKTCPYCFQKLRIRRNGDYSAMCLYCGATGVMKKLHRTT